MALEARGNEKHGYLHVGGSKFIEGELKTLRKTYGEGAYIFRSILEARWAVFFAACKFNFEYETQGYDLESGTMYIPAFRLKSVDGRCGESKGELYVEVKPNDMITIEDKIKINRFYKMGLNEYNKKLHYLYRSGLAEYAKEIIGDEELNFDSKTPILVVGNIPKAQNIKDIMDEIYNMGVSGINYNFETIDGDDYPAIPGINKKGKFELFGYNINYLENMDKNATEIVYRTAQQATFEKFPKKELW